MSWNKEDLSNYNKADSPSFTVYDNGKVDIKDKIGISDNRIGLQPWGMYKLVYEWLESNHHLSQEEKENLIELLKR